MRSTTLTRLSIFASLASADSYLGVAEEEDKISSFKDYVPDSKGDPSSSKDAETPAPSASDSKDSKEESNDSGKDMQKTGMGTPSGPPFPHLSIQDSQQNTSHSHP